MSHPPPASDGLGDGSEWPELSPPFVSETELAEEAVEEDEHRVEDEDAVEYDPK